LLRFIFSFFLIVAASGCGGRELQRTGNVEASLLCEAESIQPGSPFWVGVRLKMKKGWHTYWKDPGESGMATTIRWDLPPGFSAGSIEWPVPERFKDPAGVSYGYKDLVVLPVRVVPPKDMEEGREVLISAKVLWLECADVCLPGKAELKMALSVKFVPPEIRWESSIILSEARSKKARGLLK
jgi:thiol:disulfide interchange protein DsbD